MQSIAIDDLKLAEALLAGERRLLEMVATGEPLAFGAGNVRVGRPEPLFTIDAEARAAIHSVVSFDVSADGSRFVIPSMTPGESSALVVLQDWESLVAK